MVADTETPARSEGSAPRTLVTGACGFTGRYMVNALLAAGHHVVALARPGRRHTLSYTPQLTTLSCDITRADELRACFSGLHFDHMVHLAGMAFVAHSNVSEIYRANLIGTLNLLEALARQACPPDSVLLASSANIYGNVAHATGISETQLPTPVNHYAISKMAMELSAAQFADHLPIVIARPFNYTGVGQGTNFLIPKLVHHFQQRSPQLALGNQDIVRDFSDVRWVVDVYRRLLLQAPAGSVVNVCSGVGWSLRQVMTRLVELSGHQPEVRTDPTLVRTNEVHRLTGNPERLRAMLGPLPAQSFMQTLAWMYATHPDESFLQRSP